jgi:hypothetical protein
MTFWLTYAALDPTFPHICWNSQLTKRSLPSGESFPPPWIWLSALCWPGSQIFSEKNEISASESLSNEIKSDKARGFESAPGANPTTFEFATTTPAMQ